MHNLPAALRLNKARRWWPRWMFRSDHVENAADILNCGLLLSREEAERRNVITHDSAGVTFIDELSPKQRRFVRLYFRPRTPTQYANEGIRPASKIEYGAHMPVPVYMLFSSRLLAQERVSFSRGRLTLNSEIGHTVDFLRSIRFDDVYHDSGVGARGPQRRAEILNARHSEVLVRDELDLHHLRYIFCRSKPERDTLLDLLDKEAESKWVDNILVDQGDKGLFHKRGTFLQECELEEDRCSFKFYDNIRSDWRGPFDLKIRFSAPSWNQRFRDKNYTVGSDRLKLRFKDPHPDYRVRVSLNGDLSYQSEFNLSGLTESIF